MEKGQTPVEWLETKINTYDFSMGLAQLRKYIQQAKHLEREREAQTKGYWFGRGVLAGKEDRIGELKPTSPPPITEEEKDHNEFIRKLSEAMDRETEWIENREGLI